MTTNSVSAKTVPTTGKKPIHNQFTGIGRLGRDPEMRYSPEGRAWCKTSLAIYQGQDKEPIWLDLKAFAQRGGRLVFFTAGVQDLEPAKLLSREGLLAAQPQRWVQAITYPEPRPCPGVSLDVDEQAARSLSNYRFDQIALKGYWLCRPAAQGQCLWRLAGGEGLLYAAPCGHGLSIFVNTSIDDSLGLLSKSPAWVAFCRCLIGQADQVRQFCFSTGERPILRVADRGSAEYKAPDERATVTVENCDGSRAKAVAQGNLLLLPPPAGIGWMKTTDAPALYAGINLPAGETDLTAPAPERVADLVQRAFVTQRVPTGDRSNPVEAAVSGLRQKPVWPIVERPVPKSDVPGERAAATQPVPTKPPAFAKQGFTEDDVIEVPIGTERYRVYVQVYGDYVNRSGLPGVRSFNADNPYLRVSVARVLAARNGR